MDRDEQICDNANRAKLVKDVHQAMPPAIHMCETFQSTMLGKM